MIRLDKHVKFKFIAESRVTMMLLLLVDRIIYFTDPFQLNLQWVKIINQSCKSNSSNCVGAMQVILIK